MAECHIIRQLSIFQCYKRRQYFRNTCRIFMSIYILGIQNCSRSDFHNNSGFSISPRSLRPVLISIRFHRHIIDLLQFLSLLFFRCQCLRICTLCVYGLCILRSRYPCRIYTHRSISCKRHCHKCRKHRRDDSFAWYHWHFLQVFFLLSLFILSHFSAGFYNYLHKKTR